MSVRVGDEIVAGGQGDMYTKAQVDALIANAIAQTTEKPGMIKPFAGTTVPTGYLLCDGSAVSRTTYADLFAAIGTTYGSGDGSTTFNLPNFSYKQIGNSIACKGDGKIMGCMDGNGRLFGLSGWDNNITYLSRDTGLYGKTLPAARTSFFTGNSGIGLTTDKTKSGVVADTSGLSGCNMCIKY